MTQPHNLARTPTVHFAISLLLRTKLWLGVRTGTRELSGAGVSLPANENSQ